PGGPASRALVVRIGPGQHLLELQPGGVQVVADAAVLFEQSGKGGPARQTAPSSSQRMVDCPPGFAGGFTDTPRLGRRPRASAGVVRVNPLENLVEGEVGRQVLVAPPPAFEQEFGQRRAAGKAAMPLLEGLVYGAPGQGEFIGSEAV